MTRPLSCISSCTQVRERALEAAQAVARDAHARETLDRTELVANLILQDKSSPNDLIAGLQGWFARDGAHAIQCWECLVRLCGPALYTHVQKKHSWKWKVHKEVNNRFLSFASVMFGRDVRDAGQHIEHIKDGFQA